MKYIVIIFTFFVFMSGCASDGTKMEGINNNVSAYKEFCIETTNLADSIMRMRQNGISRERVIKLNTFDRSSMAYEFYNEFVKEAYKRPVGSSAIDKDMAVYAFQGEYFRSCLSDIPK